MFDVLNAVGGIVVMLVLGYGIVCFVALQVLGNIVGARPLQVDDVDDSLSVYYLVPCVDGAAVIAGTVEHLLTQPGDGRVLVIDDGSTDDTVAIAEEAGAAEVFVIRRSPPQARQGRSAALNHALPHVVNEVRRRGLDPARVVVCVLDVAGRLSPDAPRLVGSLFADDRTGAAQLPVRIRNPRTLFARVQDIGVAGTASTAQHGRDLLGTVVLNGNGQFTRLSALLELGLEPWSDSLAADLDLMVSLTLAGWRCRTSTSAWVEQDAVAGWGALVRQRTRWAHGRLMCAGRSWRVWRSGRVGTISATELCLQLLRPWCSTLPWSVMAPVVFAGVVVGVFALGSWAGAGVAVAAALGVYAVAFVPHAYAAWLYAARSGDYGLVRSYWAQHAAHVLIVVDFVAVWMALARIMTRGSGRPAHRGDL
ncbi:glycosyltransferase family 2 protein [Stackebrandtia soli]|uniref:glycosyltransferase family 2 protein n=1 Tax=Stackebrandtia soli TaxID=1892856 RepID=UPI0039EBF2EB